MYCIYLHCIICSDFHIDLMSNVVDIEVALLPLYICVCGTVLYLDTFYYLFTVLTRVLCL